MMIDGVLINGITCDSRKVKKGYAFVAIKGDKEDGSQYIDKAIENGAVVVYTQKNISHKTVPIIKVDNPRIKLAELLNQFYNYPSEKIKLIGVTGTNGKTTTTYLIDSLLKEGGYKTGIIGTLGIRMGNESISSQLTTPDAETLFSILNKMVEKGVEVVIMEVSSHGLKYHRTYGLDFDIAIHTNITQDHMDFHKSQEDYINTKKELFDSLKTNKIAILNIDDENVTRIIKDNKEALVITYGFSSKSTVTASSLQSDLTTKFNVCLQRGLTTIYGEEMQPFEFPLTLNLLGKHNVYNSLAAITVAIYFGVDLQSISSALAKFRGLSRRMEKIYNNRFIVIDDFCHNPSSYEVVFETIQGLQYNKIIVVNAVRGSRGTRINKYNAEVISQWYQILGVREVILSLSDDIVTEKDRVTKEELMVYKRIFNNSNMSYRIEDTLKKSLIKSLEIVEDDDIVLLLGAQGMDKGKEFITNIISLKEKNIG